MEKIKALIYSGEITVQDLIDYLKDSHYEVIDLWED